MDSPYFDPRQSIFEDPSESKGHPFGNLSTGPSISGTQNLASPVGAQSSSEHMYLSHEAPSPSSGIVITAHSGCFRSSLFEYIFSFSLLLNQIKIVDLFFCLFASFISSDRCSCK